MKKKQFGILQGRILPEKKKFNVFPSQWKKEMYLANKYGLSYIELMIDENLSKKNPILKGHITYLLNTIKKNNLLSYSLIISYFTRYSILKTKEIFLEKIFKLSSMLNIKILIIPLIENSSLKKKDLIKILDLIYIRTLSYKFKIAFETNQNLTLYNILKSEKYKDKFGLCYDIGNSFSNKSFFENDIYKFNKYLYHLHLKDKCKVKNSFQSVYLGKGLLDLKKLRKILSKIKYKYKITLETFYEKNSINSLEYNLDRVKKYLINV